MNSDNPKYRLNWLKPKVAVLLQPQALTEFLQTGEVNIARSARFSR